MVEDCREASASDWTDRDEPNSEDDRFLGSGSDFEKKYDENFQAKVTSCSELAV